MDEFFVEVVADQTGTYIVHKECCPELPAKEALRWLGVRSNTYAPLKEAANWFGNSSPCPKCMPS